MKLECGTVIRGILNQHHLFPPEQYTYDPYFPAELTSITVIQQGKVRLLCGDPSVPLSVGIIGTGFTTVHDGTLEMFTHSRSPVVLPWSFLERVH